MGRTMTTGHGEGDRVESRVFRFGRRGAGGAALLALALGLIAACAFDKEDTSPEGRQAILAVQSYRLPLGNTVADGVTTWIYARQDSGDEIKGRTWHAFQRVSPWDKSYRVAFRYERITHGDIAVQTRDDEIRFVYRVKTGAVEPENELARHVMGRD
jgi:hypothetical protein